MEDDTTEPWLTPKASDGILAVVIPLFTTDPPSKAPLPGSTSSRRLTVEREPHACSSKLEKVLTNCELPTDNPNSSARSDSSEQQQQQQPAPASQSAELDGVWKDLVTNDPPSSSDNSKEPRQLGEAEATAGKVDGPWKDLVKEPSTTTDHAQLAAEREATLKELEVENAAPARAEVFRPAEPLHEIAFLGAGGGCQPRKDAAGGAGSSLQPSSPVSRLTELCRHCPVIPLIALPPLLGFFFGRSLPRGGSGDRK